MLPASVTLDLRCGERERRTFQAGRRAPWVIPETAREKDLQGGNRAEMAAVPAVHGADGLRKDAPDGGDCAPKGREIKIVK